MWGETDIEAGPPTSESIHVSIRGVRDRQDVTIRQVGHLKPLLYYGDTKEWNKPMPASEACMNILSHAVWGKSSLQTTSDTHLVHTLPVISHINPSDSSRDFLSDTAEPPFCSQETLGCRRRSDSRSSAFRKLVLKTARHVSPSEYCLDRCCLVTSLLLMVIVLLYGSHVEPRSDDTVAHPTGPMHSEAPAPITVINMAAVLRPKNDSQQGSEPGHKQHLCERNGWMFHESLPHTSCRTGFRNAAATPEDSSPRPIMKQVQGCRGNRAAASTDASRL